MELEASGGGYGDATASVTVNVEDDDASLVLSEDSLDIGEAGSGTFTVNLAARPTGSVTVSLSSGDARAASVSPSSLSFSTSNWTRAQTVTVSGVNDADVANEEVEVELEASGGGYGDATASVTVNVEDDDASLVLSEDSLDIGEAGSGTFTVNLAARPTGSVTVSLSSGDARAASVSPSSLSFSTSNWTRAQTVTVSGVNDADVANEEVEVELEASGGGYGDATASVTVNVEDDDASLVLSEDSLDIGEAGSGTFTVNLAARPTGSVTVSLSSGDARAASVSPSSLSFSTSNWTRAQTVTVSGVNDADVRDEEVTVSLSATGGGYGGKTASVTVNVTDGEIQFPVLSEPGLEVDEADRKKIVATSTLPDPNFYYRVSLLRSEDGVTYEVEPGFEHDPASTTEFEAEFSPNRPGLYKVELRACRDADRTICAHVESSKHLTKLEAPDNLDVRPLPPDGRQGKAGLSWTGDATATMYVVEVKWDGQEWTAPIRNFTTSSIVMMAEYDITLDEISGLKVRDQGRDSDFNYDHGLSVAPYAYTFHVRAKGSGDILDSNDSAPVTIIDTPILSANGTSPMDGPGEVLVKWRKPGGATGYKIRWRELGADTDGNLHDSEGKLSETEAQADELWLLDPSSVPADYDDDEDIDDPSIDQYRIEGLGLYEIYGVQLNYTTTEGWVFSAQDFYVWPSDRPAGHGETVATYPLKNYLKDATYTYYICDKSFPSRHGDWIRLINHAMDHWVDATDGLVQMVHQDGDMPEGSGICADFSGYVNHIVSMYNKLSPEEAEATTTKGFVMGVLSTMHDLGMRRMEQLTANEILMADDVSTSSKVTNFPEISREVARGTCIKRGDSKADACVTTTAVFEEGNLKFSVALRNVFAFKDNDRRKLGLRDTDIEFYSDILLARSFYEKVLNEFQEGSATEPLPRPGDLPHDVRLVDSEAKVCPTIYQALIHEAGHAMGVSFRLNTVPGDSTHSAKTIGPTVMRRTACTTAPFDVLAIYALYQTYGRTE